MGSERLNKVLEFIRSETERIWLNEPMDIDRVKHRMGAKGQSLTVVFFANREVSAIAKFFYGFRQLTLSEDTVDLETLKKATLQLLRGASEMFGQIIYNMPDAQMVYSRALEVLPEAKTQDEYQALVEELIHYSVRLEQWTDRAIPWKPLSDVFMASLK
jgi:hypothetical protein